jgi:hypothetical protein
MGSQAERPQNGKRPALRVTHTITVDGKRVTDGEWYAYAAHGAWLAAKGKLKSRSGQARSPR